MNLHQLFVQKPCVFSIEVFPPKKDGAKPESLYPVLEQLARLQPDYISVTCGAGGSAADSTTGQIAAHIRRELGVEALAHLTCVHSTRAQMNAALDALQKDGIENILALRGDVVPGVPRCTDFLHASDLAGAIREHGGFNVVGACYPEGHVESASLREDVRSLHFKAEAGVTQLITQLFFDNLSFYRFTNLVRKEGLALPIQAGVMPIVSKRQVERTVALSSASLPPKFTKMLSRYDNDEAGLFEAGIEYAIEQIRDLIEGGADGIHLYAMNKPEVARRVCEGISDLLRPGQGVCGAAEAR